MLKRYTFPEMENLWSEENKFRMWLKVELAFLHARVIAGELSSTAYKAIARNANFRVSRIHRLEKKYGHDMIAFITCVQESLVKAGVGQYKEEFHKKLTSYDVEDPAAILMLRESANIILRDLKVLYKTLNRLSLEYRHTMMILRSHGQFAEPGTFGALLRVFMHAIDRSIKRIERSLKTELSEAKMSGAVGMFGGMDPVLEKLALTELGLKPAKSETQIVQRDRHAAYLSTLTIMAASVEQMAKTLHVMTHSLIGELKEGRTKHQRGSSAMSQKENPITLEQLFGLPRKLRGDLGAAIENIATLEARDISQSSVERHIFPDITGLAQYIAVKARVVLEHLVVNTKRLEDNLVIRSLGVWATQPVRTKLMEHGVSYKIAYEFTQKCAFKAKETETQFKEVLLKAIVPRSGKKTVVDIIGQELFNECFDPVLYIYKGNRHIFSR